KLQGGAGGAVGFTWGPEPGRWYHVALSYEWAARSLRLYLDGALVAMATGTSIPAYDDHPLMIGADFEYNAVSGWFIGDIDEVRLWTTVRTLDEIKADLKDCLVGPAAGLRGYWPLDEGMGQTSTEVS